MNPILRIEPYDEPRMWGGGRRLREEFHYKTDTAPLGEVYNIVALPGHVDCRVPEPGLTLSQLYESRPQYFECDTRQLPIRINILDPLADLSIQIHPDDDFARTWNGGRGKPEAWVILDTPEEGKIEFGHHARTRQEFRQLAASGQWDRLIEFQDFPAIPEHDLMVTRYTDNPGLYTLFRLQCAKKGRFLHDRFAFYTCVKGEGTINGVPIRQGETLLVPAHSGWMEFEGDMDLFLASYRSLS